MNLKLSGAKYESITSNPYSAPYTGNPEARPKHGNSLKKAWNKPNLQESTEYSSSVTSIMTIKKHKVN